MSEPIHKEDMPNWQMFYRKLCHIGPVALTGLPREWIPMLQSYARTGDLFWSDCLQAALRATTIARFISSMTDEIVPLFLKCS